MDVSKSDIKRVAVCGLFCPACTYFIATNEDPERLKRLAAMRNLPVEDLRCEGCRAEIRTGYCKSCSFSACATKKGIEFCGECADYPCTELKEFQSVKAHRLELWRSQDRIKEVGYEQWYTEMLEHFSCENCNTINSAYDSVCRKCGKSPSNSYNRLHGEEIKERIAGK